MALRRAVRADVPEILRLIRALAEYEKLSHEVVAGESALAETLFGARPAAEVLLAEEEGRAVGFALFFQNYSTFLARPGIYLEDLFVEPAWRGRGIGGELLKAIARLAVKRGCGRFEWAVLDWNEPAIAFYTGLGAKPMADWTVMRVTGEALKRLGS
ncbi:MAG: GNAT family N-acetyltransferase [Nevskiaceae bacterium]